MKVVDADEQVEEDAHQSVVGSRQCEDDVQKVADEGEHLRDTIVEDLEVSCDRLR